VFLDQCCLHLAKWSIYIYTVYIDIEEKVLVLLDQVLSEKCVFSRFLKIAGLFIE